MTGPTAAEAPAAPVPAAAVAAVPLVLIIGLALSQVASGIDSTIVATALPSIVSELDGMGALAWVATSYLIMLMASIQAWGKLGDVYGRRRVILVAQAVFAAGSLLCMAAQSMEQLVLFRGLQGLGAGGCTALPAAIAADVMPPRQLGRFHAVLGGSLALSLVIGPVVGGVLVDRVSWRAIFVVSLACLAVSMAIVWNRLDRRHTKVGASIDWVGAALLAAAVTAAVLFATSSGVRSGWRSDSAVPIGVGSVVLVAAFVAWERRAPEPVLPLRLLANRALVTVLVVSAMGYAAGLSMIYFIPVFLQVVRGTSPTRSGLLLIAYLLASSAGVVISARTVTRTGHYRVFVVVGPALTLVALLLLTTITATTSWLPILLYSAVGGLGVGLWVQVLVIVGQNAVERRDLGVATSAIMLARSFGGAFGVAIFGAIFTSSLRRHAGRFLAGSGLDVDGLRADPDSWDVLRPTARRGVTDSFTLSLHTVWAVSAAAMVACLVLGVLMRERTLRETM